MSALAAAAAAAPPSPLRGAAAYAAGAAASLRSACSLRFVATVNEYAVRFGCHIALLSIFENVFFWEFVGPVEDTTLFNVLQSYLTGTLASCPAWTPGERAFLGALASLIFNKTAIDAQGAAASASRTAYNGALRRTSWLYVLGLFALLALLSGQTLWRKKQLPWRTIFVENLVMIVFLGVYEYFFFTTIILPYKSISTPELDRMLVDELSDHCFNGSWTRSASVGVDVRALELG